SVDRPLDIHLMIEDPDRWAPGYAEAGAESVTFHLEAARAPVRLARQLRRLGARVGAALNPATPLAQAGELWGEVDMILLMTVEPGFGGQGFLESVLPKITALRRVAGRDGIELSIQVDGGVSLDTIERCAAAGADNFVVGSAIFSAPDPEAMVRALRQRAQAAAGQAFGGGVSGG
ncbi:MAG: ribulose-phosphate 3-epimerase, partial [Propionibacteriaceae bacterium]|nr:ribulose-phosphate 3-epimerase [Propionibacteriaceae bacterium]